MVVSSQNSEVFPEISVSPSPFLGKRISEISCESDHAVLDAAMAPFFKGFRGRTSVRNMVIEKEIYSEFGVPERARLQIAAFFDESGNPRWIFISILELLTKRIKEEKQDDDSIADLFKSSLDGLDFNFGFEEIFN